MSELKDYWIPTRSDNVCHCYLKSEADKVIADLEQKLAAAQQVLRLNEPKALYSNLETMGRLKHEIDVVARRERHHKYKRCLLRSVIAEMNATHFKDLFYGAGSEALADEYNKQVTIHYKWQKRWLALAEKFKEAK